MKRERTSAIDRASPLERRALRGYLFFNPAQLKGGSSGGSGGGLGKVITFTSPSGASVDPNIVGFVAGVGSAGTGRIRVTLSGDTTWVGFPAGADGQQTMIEVVSGNFTLTLAAFGVTTQKQFQGSRSISYVLDDTASIYYDSGAAVWPIVA